MIDLSCQILLENNCFAEEGVVAVVVSVCLSVGFHGAYTDK